jgi:Carboxypeptidase regulatory-like domain/TonB dependent receptor-like, beta-barrel
MRNIILFIVFLATATALFGQSDANKAQIVGTVYDPQGAVVPNATVRIQNNSTGAARELTSGPEGQFRAVLLDAGVYEVRVDAQGFSQSVYQNVTLNVGSAVNLEVKLELGGAGQEINVADTFLPIDLPNPTTTIDVGAIGNLPINGRRFQDFATLTPTVQVDTERGQLSFLGQRGINSNVMVDGSDYNNPFFGGIRGGERSNFVVTVPQSSVQEFQAVTAGYTAEYGRSSGGLLNVITKSGANDLHGESFYQVRHREMGKKTPFGIQIQETQQQFGGGAGGAIKKDKLFWFGAIERQVAKAPEAVRFTTIDSVAVNATNQEAYNYYRSLETGFEKTNNATALTGRADYQMSNGGRLTFRYNFSDAAAKNAASVGGATESLTTSALSNNGTEKDRTHTGVAQWTHILSPVVVNDLRFSISRELRPRTSNSTLPNVTNTIGQFGARNFLPTTQEDQRNQINDGISFSYGEHTFKVGGDYNYLTTYQEFGFNQFGVFSANVGTVDQILEVLSLSGPTPNRFDNPLAQYQLQIGNRLADFKMHQIAFYGQDSWRITNRFSINYGLRWEGQKNPQPVANNTAVIDKIKAATLLNGTHFDPTTTPNVYNQWMPRLGFTYSPGGSNTTVVRGHTGIFYASTPMIVLADSTNNFRLPAGNVSLSLPRLGSTVYRDLLAIGIDLNSYTLDKLPLLTADQIARAASSAGAAPDPFANARFTGTANDFTNPRSLQAGLGVEQSLHDSWVVSAQFNYLNTVHLQRNRDENLPQPQINPADAAKRPNFGQVGAFRIPRPIAGVDRLVLRESSARSMYRGVTFETKYRGRRYQGGFNYTISGAYSDDDNERSSTTLYYQTPTDLVSEYSVSRMDALHQLSGYGLVNLPGGITATASLRARSGFPMDAAAGSDLNGDGNYTIPGVVTSPTGGASSDRPYTAPGVSMKRNAYRNRSFKNVDLRLLKSFQLGENKRVEFSTEMFNVFNIDNIVFDRTNLVYGPGIDSVTGAIVPVRTTFQQLKLANGQYDPVNNQLGTPFQAQFGLRFFF